MIVFHFAAGRQKLIDLSEAGPEGQMIPGEPPLVLTQQWAQIARLPPRQYSAVELETNVGGKLARTDHRGSTVVAEDLHPTIDDLHLRSFVAGLPIRTQL